MVSFTTTALAAFVGTAAATGWGRGGGGGWGKAPSFNCPGNPSTPPSVCTPQQASGWDFSGFQYGQTCNTYDGTRWSSSGASWKYTEGLFGKGSSFAGRGLEARTGGRGGCMSADLKDEPRYSCGSDRSFDAASFNLVTQEDADIELVFTQKNGGTCSQYARCSKQGTTVKNSQCYGATGVTFKHRGGKGKGCGIGVSSVSYGCSSTTTVVPPPPSTATPPPSTTQETTTTSTSPPTTVVSTTSTTPASTTSSTTSVVPPPSTDVSTVTVSSVTTTLSVSTTLITTSATVTSCESTVTDCPASSTVVTSTVLTSFVTTPVTVPTTIATVTTLSTSTEITQTTVYVTTSTTICPVTQTQTQGNGTVVTTFLSTSLIPITVTTTAITTAPAPPAQSQPPTGNCPDSVPQCLNTWLHTVPECKDNTDSACFCTDPEYTEKIIECLEAYSGSDMSNAISYFQGICAPYAEENPQPFTGVPSTITVTAPAVPQTTITITSAGSTMTVPVPAVTFTTPATTAGSTDAPGLVPVGTAPLSSTTIAVGTGGLPSQPTTTGPAIATGAASKDLVSGAVALVALVAAILMV